MTMRMTIRTSQAKYAWIAAMIWSAIDGAGTGTGCGGITTGVIAGVTGVGGMVFVGLGPNPSGVGWVPSYPTSFVPLFTQ